MRVRYPRTPHLPWSPGAASDDVRLAGLSGLEGREVVVTEKLDGENTSLYRDGLHARSLDSAHHPSRAWVKALHGRIGRQIPQGWRVCGENLHARHSIAYDALESWFYAFSVWDGEDRCLDWDATVRFARRLGVPVPAVLWRGVFDEKAIRALKLDPSRQEGYVVRTAAGFPREAFAAHVAKWVRAGHVQTDEHWMLAALVENGRSPASALWEARSGARVAAGPLLRALEAAAAGSTDAEGGAPRAQEAAEAVLGEALARLDVLGRTGDARLAGALAALLHARRRGALMLELAAALDVSLARRVADLVGLHARLQAPFPDEERRDGLRRMALAADVGVLHAVAAAALAGRTDAEADAAREQVAWSELHAAEAGLLAEAPLAGLRAGLRGALSGLEPEAADRCWAEALEAYAAGRLSSAEEAAGLVWRWRGGRWPCLALTCGPAGSGKSRFAASVLADHAAVSLDELRTARGARADQKDNAAVLREALGQLEARLAAGERVVWDATALNRQQRSLPLGAARRRDALATCVVFLAPARLLHERNATRAHSVPAHVLDAQIERFAPPYPGEAHRTWYVGPAGTRCDTAGTLAGEEP